MKHVIGRVRAAQGRAVTSLAALAMAVGLAAIPGTASASAAQHLSPARAASSATGHGPQPAALAMLEQRARASLHRQVPHVSSITGTVLGASGLPLAGACVTAYGQSGSVTATAGPSGTFTVVGLAAGSYTLEYRDCAAPARYLTTWSGGAGFRSTAARIQVGANQVRHVPFMMMRQLNPGALRLGTTTWHRLLANASGRGLSPAAAARTGQISGVVTGKGKKLPGICVAAFPPNGGQGYGATTGKHGTYTIRHVPAGRYNVTFAPWFCQKGNWLQQVYRGHTGLFGIGDVVKVTSGKTTKGIDARLRLGGEITGTVSTKSGRKLGGICVNVFGQVAGGFVGLGGLATARNGSYALHALFPGKWSLDFSTGCGTNANYAPTTHLVIRIKYGKIVTNANEVMVPGGIITGTVRLGSSSGTPLSGICVFASNSDQSITANAATNASGRYRLIGLGTGNYQVQFSPGCSNNGNYVGTTKYAHATEGKVTGGVNAVMLPGAMISGVVTDTHGHPLAGMCIQVNGPSYGNSPGATLADGSYVVNQLTAGTYQLGFATGCGNSGNYAPYWYNNQSDPSLATPIKLTVGASLTINAQMQPGAAISGTVTDSHGRKLTGICIFAVGAGSLQFTFSKHGTYHITGLAPGQYSVDFTCGGSSRYADQWFPNAPDAGTAELVSVPAGQTTGVNAALQPAGVIAGIVRGPSGKPLAGVCASAYNTRDRSTTIVSTIGGPGGGQTSNSRGAYRISGLAAGRYRVLFNQCAVHPRYASQWYRGQDSQLSALPVTVRSGATTKGIDASMRLAGVITGRVVNSTGKPLNNICVFAASSGGQFGFSSTGKTGDYAIGGVATGNYTVSFLPCDSSVNLVSVFTLTKVTAPLTTKGVNARLVPGGSASGVVTVAGSGGPVAYACVEFISPNPANPGGFFGTGPDGSYRATGLAPGSYQVLFNDPLCGTNGLAPQWYNNQPTKATATKVTITVGNTTPGINAALQADGTITGSVHGPSSTALSGVCVTVVPLLAGSVPIVAISKAAGFTVPDLLPGRYKVEFSSGCGATGYKTQWWKNASSRQTATAINVAATQLVPGIDATLTH